MTRIILRIIEFYRKSPWAAWRRRNKLRCRFIPSCSEYCELAIVKYGPRKGLLLSIWRLLRCNPWNYGSCIDFP
ncbi:MAG: membrane protein insertion efficiency factor YidD [Nanoarchaeota archaeon]|nr:membrane protein insertion efficiency factor YidD [Nanoarchaeota archaeon]